MKPIRYTADLDNLQVLAHHADGRTTVVVAKIVNEKGLKRVLKSHATWAGLTVAKDGLSAA